MSLEAEPLLELMEPPLERLKVAFQGLIFGGVFGWAAMVGALQFWILPHETNQRRAALAAVLVAPIVLGVIWHAGCRRYHAVRVEPDRIELRRGTTCDQLRAADVLGLIGLGGINLDGGELVARKRLVILTDERRYVLAFHRENNAELYRVLRDACRLAWGVPYPARLEPPTLTDHPGNGPAALGPV